MINFIKGGQGMIDKTKVMNALLSTWCGGVILSAKVGAIIIVYALFI